MIYISSPIAHRSRLVEYRRLAEATRYAVGLMRKGIPVFSPAAHSLGMGLIGQEEARGINRRVWMLADLAVLRACSELHVLMLPGWRQSVGVKAEIREARKHGIPVEYVRPDGNLETAERDQAAESAREQMPYIVARRFIEAYRNPGNKEVPRV
jgi:hypothetical protein